MPHSGLNSAPVVLGSGSATVSSSAVPITDESFGFTEEQLNRANRAVITAHAQPIHFRYDGEDPTSTIGHMADDNSSPMPRIVLGNENVRNLIFIKESGTDSTVTVTLEDLPTALFSG